MIYFYLDETKSGESNSKALSKTNLTYCETAKLRALRAHVPTRLACIRAHVPRCLVCFRVYVPTCVACLRAHVPTCLASLRAHVPMFLTCLCVNLSCVPTCLCSDFKQQKQVFNDMFSLDLKWNCIWKVLQQECL